MSGYWGPYWGPYWGDYWGAGASAAAEAAAAAAAGGRSSKRQRRWIRYADGNMREFQDNRAYMAEVSRLLAKKVPEAVERQEPPETQEIRLPVIKLRPEMLALLAKLQDQERELLIMALIDEAQAFYRTKAEAKIDDENRELLLMLGQIV